MDELVRDVWTISYVLPGSGLVVAEVSIASAMPIRYHMENNVCWTPRNDVLQVSPEVIAYAGEGHPVVGNRLILTPIKAGTNCYIRRSQPFGFLPPEDSWPMQFQVITAREHIGGASDVYTPKIDPNAKVIYRTRVTAGIINGQKVGLVEGVSDPPLIRPTDEIGMIIDVEVDMDRSPA